MRDKELGDSLVHTAHKSRGELVTDFLISTMSPLEYCTLIKDTELHGTPQPFNLVCGVYGVKIDDDTSVSDVSTAGCDGSYNAPDVSLWFNFYYLSGRRMEIQPLPCGVSVISNAELNTPWPKVKRMREALQSRDEKAIYETMCNTETCSDSDLPTGTGYPLEVERMLSSIKIIQPTYHTRCTSYVAITPVISLDGIETPEVIERGADLNKSNGKVHIEKRYCKVYVKEESYCSDGTTINIAEFVT